MTTNSPSPGAFIGGFFLGVILGGVASLFVTLLLDGAVALIDSGLQSAHLARFSVSPVYGFVGVYALAVFFGFLAIRFIRARLDFASGFMTGFAASFLGVTALCNSLVGGLGSMH